ncbi:lysostaphin resistance A-like protein [Erwinia sp.]|uniref:CPBP family intramembrane glutamic endopeptidase n=1 Tax=Erwinia citreus TaxID=558 RepID=UPI003C76736B
MNNHADRVTCTLLCMGMCLVWYSLTVMLRALPGYPALLENGLLMPVLCALEFCVLVPLYRWYAKHYNNIPLGKITLRQLLIFSGLLLCLILSQSFYLQQESWTGGQFGEGKSKILLFSLAVVLLAPVFEEILFRGFVLQGLLLWAPRQRLACALLTSIGFAAMHTQYTHPQTLIALIALSLLLCYARLISGGLKLPIALHMLNNLIGVSPWLWLAVNG